LVLQQSAPAVVATAEVPKPAAPSLAATRVMIGNGNPQVMLRDPRLDQLLEAHQQAGGASQMPSGFLRNATFDRPSR
jgi:sigma-E factor negative regulatory protein RseA